MSDHDQELERMMGETADKAVMPIMPQGKVAGPADAEPEIDVSEPDIDEDQLGEYLLSTLRNDIRDRETAAFEEKRYYDIKAYYGLKDPEMQNYPWKNASAYPTQITPVMLDTLNSTIDDTLFRDKSKVTNVIGTSKEDKRNAQNLQHILNHQITSRIEGM